MPEIRHGQVVDGHLGGYVPGGDPYTTYPKLWKWFLDEVGVRSVLDVGCGDGSGALSFFGNHEVGCRILGIDGIPQERAGIVQHDYTTGPRDQFPPGFARRDFDLVWSAEFVEHVEEQYVRYYLRDFALAPLIAMTHAVPGQGGWHHVNCQRADYWIGALAAIGYRLDKQLTEEGRRRAFRERTIPREGNYFGRSGLIFRRA